MAMSNVSLDILKSYSTAINSSRHWAQALSLLKDLQDLRLADLIATSAAINSIGRRSAWRCATGLLPRSADVIAFNAALKALATRWRQAMQLLQDMAISSLQSDIISMNSMVNACAKASLWQWVTLQLQTTQDRVTYCCCISALEKDCEWQRAQQLFWELRHTFSCDLIAYNASMSSYEKAGNWDLSLLLFDDLKEHRLSPDVITFNAAISSQQAQWQFANHLLDSLRLQRAYPEVISYSAATHCCALASSWQHAVQTAAGRGADAVTGHDGRGRRGPVPCNAAINACEKVAKWPWALHSFAILPTRRWTPDEVTCGSVMSALVGWQQEIAANVAREHNSPASSVVSEPNPEPAPCLARAASDPTELVVGEEMRQVRTMRTSERVHSWLSERVHPNHRTCSESDLEVGRMHTGLPKNTTILQLLIGSTMAVVAGTLFGTTFVLPTDLLQGDFGNQHSKSIMDYVFSHFIGIFLMAAFALVLYAAIMAIRRKSCYTPLRLVIPALSSGVIWGIAQVAWFQANLDLGFSVPFPVIASLPGVIGLLIGICCFGEVGSFWSRVFAALGLLLRIPGVIFIALSA